MVYELFFGSPDIASAVLLLFAGWIVLKYIAVIPVADAFGGSVGGMQALIGMPDFRFLETGGLGLIKLAMVAMVIYLFWPILFYQELIVFLAIAAAMTWAAHNFFGFDYAWSAVAGLLCLIAFTSNGFLF